jgi:hypothetical protein
MWMCGWAKLGRMSDAAFGVEGIGDDDRVRIDVMVPSVSMEMSSWD